MLTEQLNLEFCEVVWLFTVKTCSGQVAVLKELG